MTICPLFSGAELYYNDMHLVSFDEAPAPARNVIEINHCAWGVTSAVLGKIAAAIWQQGILRCVQRRAKVVLLLSAAALPRHHHPTGSGCDFAGNAETNGMVRRRP